MICKTIDKWCCLLSVSLIILFFLVSCGYKDQPVPPRQVTPLPIGDLSYQLDDGGVTLSWSYPAMSVTGSNIADILSFKVYRAVISPGDYCPTCPVIFADPVIIPGDVVSDKGRKTATYKTSLLRPGNMYLFKVRSVGGWWAESEYSNIVSFYWQPPPMAPAKLVVSPKDGSIALSWQATTTKLDNSPVNAIIEYQIYRSSNDIKFIPLGKPVTETSFIDNEIINNKKYFYKVQALAVYPEGTVGGGKTDSISASSPDLTPPPIPDGIRVISTGTAVRVFWEPVKAADLKKYMVYRRIESESTAKLIGTVTAPFAMYLDSDIPKESRRDLIIFYSVSSVDSSIPGNESHRSTEIEVRR